MSIVTPARNTLAVVAGLVGGLSLNMALIELNMRVVFPLPAGVDMNDPVALGGFIETLPPQGFLLVILAHLGQSFFGGWIAARLAASRPMALALVIGVISLAGGIMAMTMIPGPPWLMIELPLYLVVAWWAGRMELRRRAALNPSDAPSS